jgi:signal transduction histidine kinase
MNTSKEMYEKRISQLENSIKILAEEKAGLATENSRLIKELDYYSSRTSSPAIDEVLPEDMKKMIAGFTHDLKNQNSKLSILLSTAFRKIQDENLAVVFKRSQYTVKRIESILEAMRNALKLGQLQKAPVDIVALVKESIEMVGDTSSPGITICYESGFDQPIHVLGNKGQLKVTILGILDNAVEAMKSTGTLTVKLGELRKSNRHMIELVIQDTGSGIPSRNLERVFDLRFSTKRSGWGLGLHLAKQAVEDMGGEIRLDSEEGVGTTVSIMLPIVD